MIGDGADAQGALAVPGGVHVESRSLHFQRHDAHFPQAVHAVQPLRHTHMVAVEHIGGIDVAHMVGGPVVFRSLHRFGQKLKACDGGKGAGQVELGGKVGIGAGALRDDQIIEVDIVLNGPGGAHPDNILHTVAVIQLVGVDADGGHTHTGGHDGDLDALVGAGIALNAPDVVN